MTRRWIWCFDMLEPNWKRKRISIIFFLLFVVGGPISNSKATIPTENRILLNCQRRKVVHFIPTCFYCNKFVTNFTKDSLYGFYCWLCDKQHLKQRKRWCMRQKMGRDGEEEEKKNKYILKWFCWCFERFYPSTVQWNRLKFNLFLFAFEVNITMKFVLFFASSLDLFIRWKALRLALSMLDIE